MACSWDIIRKLNLNPHSYFMFIIELPLRSRCVRMFCAIILQKTFMLGEIRKGEHFYRKQFTSDFSAFSLPLRENVGLNKSVLPRSSSSRGARNRAEVIFLHQSAGLERDSESWTQPSN